MKNSSLVCNGTTLEESDLTSNTNVTFFGNSAFNGGGMYANNSNMKFMRF